MLKRNGEPAARTAEREIYWLARTQQTDNFVEKLSRTTHWSISSAALYVYMCSRAALKMEFPSVHRVQASSMKWKCILCAQYHVMYFWVERREDGLRRILETQRIKI